MTNPMIRIHNTETDEVIDREMNNDELKQYELDLLAAAEAEKQQKAAVTAKEALLTKLGITAEEAVLLLS
jgi:hypothetical protein